MMAHTKPQTAIVTYTISIEMVSYFKTLVPNLSPLNFLETKYLILATKKCLQIKI